MSFLDHPSLQQSSKDRERAEKRWTPPTNRGILEEPKKRRVRTPTEIRKSFEERMYTALKEIGRLQLRISFDLLEKQEGKRRTIYHYRPAVKAVTVKMGNQGKLLKLLEEIQKLGVDFGKE